MVLKASKGTEDILPAKSEIWQYIEEKANLVFKSSNYKEIRTPIFEATELFKRGVGDSTDIVTKEMYTFVQKERSLTLRPENTAGVVRAFIENGMHKLPVPLKLWYTGPMFRYERPQGGRKRQFHQLGVELFGIESPIADAEVIQMATWLLDELKIKNYELEVNNIGCNDCRAEYKENIKNTIKPELEEFCPDCKVRYEKNPLRMLDCKNEKCNELLSSENIKIVISSDFVCEKCLAHFSELIDILRFLNIDYTINKRMVRGLDYYNRTVFEIKASNIGAQNALCGGGRYDPLVQMLGGPSTPAVGWAMGMERLISVMQKPEIKPVKAFIVTNYQKEAILLASELRKNNISVDFDLANRKFTKQIDKSAKIQAEYSVIIGEDEMNNNFYTLKNMKTGEQEKITKNQLIKVIK